MGTVEAVCVIGEMSEVSVIQFNVKVIKEAVDQRGKDKNELELNNSVFMHILKTRMSLLERETSNFSMKYKIVLFKQ